MSGFSSQADKLQKLLNEKFGQRFYEPLALDDVMDAVRKEISHSHPDFMEQHMVEFSGMFEGKRMNSSAEIVFARFGEDDTGWIAFNFYKDGAANTLRPFTEETANMAWLETYITKELAG